MKAICWSGIVCLLLVSARESSLDDNVEIQVYIRGFRVVFQPRHEIGLTTEKETAELKSVKETNGRKKKRGKGERSGREEGGSRAGKRTREESFR